MAVVLPILIAGGGLIALLVWYMQPTLRVSRITLPVQDLPPELDGFKIAQLSDIHYDLPKKQSMTAELLNEIITTTNAEDVDIVCLTGDYVNRDPRPAEALSVELKKLGSRHGVYAVMGNHDHDGDGSVVEAHLRSANITILTNSCLSLPSHPLTIVGFDDLWHRKFRPDLARPLFDKEMQGRVGKQVVIGLSHNPDTADALINWPFDLLLSGHTHGGQVVIPIINIPVIRLFKLLLRLPRFLRSFIPGQHHVYAIKDWARASGMVPLPRPDGTHLRLYVSRGLGSHGIKNFSIRIFCDPEIVVFTLRRA